MVLFPLNQIQNSIDNFLFVLQNPPDRPQNIELKHYPVSVVIPVSPNDSDLVEKTVSTFKGYDEIIKVKGGTIAEARNFGAEKARSPYLLFLDCDIDLKNLDVSILPSYDYDVGIALYDTSHIPDYLNILNQNFWATIHTPLASIGGFIYCKKSVWEKIKFRNVYIEDIDFASRAYFAGYKVRTFPVKIIHTRPFTPFYTWLQNSINKGWNPPFI